MFTISFEFYNSHNGMWCEDDFECEKSYKEFTSWLEDEGIINYRIIEILVD